MKLYTKRGDDGRTDLFGGQRVRKDSQRVEAYGAVDELNSFIGLAAVACTFAELTAILKILQNQLFDLGSDLATPHPEDDVEADSESTTENKIAPPPVTPKRAIPRITQSHIQELENFIDQTCDPLPQMRNFILPGGSELAARLHVARTVTRRVERFCVTLSGSEPIGPFVVIYLNRLSDLLFAMARRANQLQGIDDVSWISSKKS